MDGQQKSPYDALIWPIVGAVVLFAIGIAYSHYRVEINNVIMKLNDIQLSVITMLPGTEEARRVREQLLYRHPGTFEWNHMLAQIRFVASYVRWPVIAFVVLLAMLSWRRGIAYQRILSMRKLVEHNVNVFPYMAPVAWREIDQEPIDEGPWRVARQPLQWALENNLLLDVTDKNKNSEDKQKKKVLVKPKDVLTRWGIANERSVYLKGRKKMDIDMVKAKTLMQEHLGPEFKGIDSLPDYQKGLVAAFVSFGAGDKDSAEELINQMALSFAEPGRSKKDPAKEDPKQKLEIDISGADELIKKHLGNQNIKDEFDEYTVKHSAFVYPWFAATLEFARAKGVFECSKFIWLKPTNRTLWYVLNEVGRRTPWTEAAGAFVHYKAEEELARVMDSEGIDEPEIMAAVHGLRSTLVDEGWIDE